MYIKVIKLMANFSEVIKYSISTLPTAELLSGKNARAFLVCGFLMKSLKKKILMTRYRYISYEIARRIGTAPPGTDNKHYQLSSAL